MGTFLLGRCPALAWAWAVAGGGLRQRSTPHTPPPLPPCPAPPRPALPCPALPPPLQYRPPPHRKYCFSSSFTSDLMRL